MRFPRDFHFADPMLLFHLLWLVPLAGLALYGWKRKQRALDETIASSLQEKVVQNVSPPVRGLQVVLFVLGWIFALLAIMGPLANESTSRSGASAKSLTPSLELFFIVDTSLSMGVQDTVNHESRLVDAQEIADKILARDRNDPVALYAFSGGLTPLVPMTYDLFFTRLVLRDISLNEGDREGSDFSLLAEDFQKMVEERRRGAPAALILLSDGGDEPKEKAQEVINRTPGIPFYVVGLGSLKGGVVPGVLSQGSKVTSRLNEGFLKALAEASGGRYFSAESQSLDAIAEEVIQALSGERIEGGKGAYTFSSGAFQDYFQLPLIFSIFFFALYRFLPSLLARRLFALLPFLLLPSFASGEGAAFALYEAEQYKAASAAFELVLKEYPPDPIRDKLLYNYGTALLADGDREMAETAFEAIGKSPETLPLFFSRISNNLNLAVQEKGSSAVSLLAALWLKENDPKLDEVDDASLLEKVPVEFKKALQEPLEKAKGALDQGKPDDARVWLNRAGFSLLAAELKKTDAPEKVLRILMQEAAAVRRGGIEGSLLVEEALQFKHIVLKWQEEQFKKGKCVCFPWREVIPLYVEGVEAARGAEKALKEKNIEQAHLYLDKAFWKWNDAKKALKEGSQSPVDEKQKSLREQGVELQEMQALDSQEKIPIQGDKEGRKW